MLYLRNQNIVQSKHNNIFNNVKLLHVSVTSNHYQADILVHGNDMFSATVWDPILFTFQTFLWFYLAPEPILRLLFIYLFIYSLWRCDQKRVMASSFLRFLDHTQRRTTVGRTPLDEWSARRRDLYLKTHNTHNRQISMPPSGIRTHDLSRRATADLHLRLRGHWDRH